MSINGLLHRTKFAFLTLLAVVATSASFAITCPNGLNMCAYAASNPCVGADKCSPIKDLNLEGGATTLPCTDGAGEPPRATSH